MWLSVLGASIQGLWAWRWDGVKDLDAAELPFQGRVSVVVCCHNEAARLPEFAKGLRPALAAAKQAGCVVDVVAVNHGSSDRTGTVLDALAADDARWHVVHLTRTVESKKEALAAGIAASQGDVLVLLDADCAPVDASWLVNMTQGAGTAWDVGVGISLPQGLESMTFLARMQRLEARRLAQRAVGAVDAGQPYLAFGRNLAFTRDMWTRVGGFDAHLDVPSGDDDLWLQEAVKCGARVASKTSRSAQTASEWPATWRLWRRQKTRHFTASPSYPWRVKVRLLLPGLGWGLLVAGVVHNPSGTSVGLAGCALLARTLTFGKFLHRAGLPRREAWELLMEPVVSVFRVWAWCKGSTSESTSWK
ncbi:MAG: glycosyltransferase [Flavobacteriales bacterium]